MTAADGAAVPSWLTAAFKLELLHLQADAHRVHASRSGSRGAAAVLPPKGTAGGGGGGGGAGGAGATRRRTGLGPTPVVVVPAVDM